MTNQTDQQLMWRATCDLGDWFSRLGGAARYSDMKEADIFLYVAATVAEKAALISDRNEYITDQLIRAAGTAATKADEKLARIQGSTAELTAQLIDYIEHYDQKLENERSPEWIRFCHDIKEITNG